MKGLALLDSVCPFFMSQSDIYYKRKLKMKLNIKEKEIELKYTIRALFIFEKIANKTFTTTSITDMYLLFYSLIIANRPDIELTFDELIDICDNDITIFNNFATWLTSEFEKQAQFSEKKESKKKATKKI